MFGGRLKEVDYNDDISVMNGKNAEMIKARIPIEPPLKADGSKMTVEEFDKRVIEVAKSFGNNQKIKYFLSPISELQGNCNTSTSTILHKAGVSDEHIKEIGKQLPGLAKGFGSYRPWTSDEQRKAVDAANQINHQINQNFWSNWHLIK